VQWFYILTLLFGWFRVMVLPKRIRERGYLLIRTESLILQTLKGLLATGIEKIHGLELEDAQDDLKS